MNAMPKPTGETSSFSSSFAKASSGRNGRKKKSSFFSRFTKRQKTASYRRQLLSSMDVDTCASTMDQAPLTCGTAAADTGTGTNTSSQNRGIPIKSAAAAAAVDNTAPSLQSLSSSQSSDDTQANREAMQETVVSSNKTQSLYATGAQNLAALDAEFLEARSDRWRGDGRSFADLESSAQFSMSVDADDKDGALEQAIPSHGTRQEKKVASAKKVQSSLDTTSDSMPLPVLSSKQKEMAEPTVFELDSSLLSALSAISPVEESFSDDSHETQDKSSCELQELDDEELDLPEDNASQNEEEGEEKDDEQSAVTFSVFSFDYMQERLSCIGCV